MASTADVVGVMVSEANIPAFPLLFCDNLAVRGAGIEVVKELIAAGPQRADEDGDGAAADHDLFSIEVRAFEFRRRRVEILDDQGDFLARGQIELKRREAVIVERERVGRVAAPGWPDDAERDDCCGGNAKKQDA